MPPSTQIVSPMSARAEAGTRHPGMTSGVLPRLDGPLCGATNLRRRRMARCLDLLRRPGVTGTPPTPPAVHDAIDRMTVHLSRCGLSRSSGWAWGPSG